MEDHIKDYLEVFDLMPEDLTRVLDMAVRVRNDPHRTPDLIKDEIVFCYFSKPSTRTRVSFAAAIAHLGGEAKFVGPAAVCLSAVRGGFAGPLADLGRKEG